jgi:phage baseplate assembly protein W
VAKHQKASRTRVTVRLETELHQALRRKAAVTRSSVSELVDDAIRAALAEDAEDLAAFGARKHEPRLDFDEVLRDMKKRGRL